MKDAVNFVCDRPISPWGDLRHGSIRSCRPTRDLINSRGPDEHAHTAKTRTGRDNRTRAAIVPPLAPTGSSTRSARIPSRPRLATGSTTTAYAVRDRLIERWMETMRSYYRADAKRVYYLSLEFLTGRLLSNSLLNMGFYEHVPGSALGAGARRSTRSAEVEPDAALGNGGLGRLAACFLDSMATLSLPGLRLRHPLRVRHVPPADREGLAGRAAGQLAARTAIPWEFPRPEVLFPVKFGGRVVEFTDEQRRVAASTGSTPTT